ncbi:MAG: hypothetical protein ACRERU_18550 [Methylococcales bacterium]
MVAVLCAQHEAKATAHAAVYRRRRPERSAAYQVVQGHLETWLSGCRNQDEEGSPVAATIEQDFRKYLDKSAEQPIYTAKPPVRDEGSAPPATHGVSGRDGCTPG